MMISPELYYEENLKGKSSSEILSKIRGLKNEIGRLKNLIENPDYNNSKLMLYPSLETRLYCYRLYLERAKEALVESGGTYQPSKAEQRAQRIDNSIPYLSKLVFRIGGFHSGHKITTILFCDKYLKVKIETPNEINSDEERIVAYPVDKAYFMERLQDIHFGEWKSLYQNNDVLDGVQWELELYFSNGHRKVSFSGDNAYPYNFDEFCSLIDEVIDEKSDNE